MKSLSRPSSFLRIANHGFWGNGTGMESSWRAGQLFAGELVRTRNAAMSSVLCIARFMSSQPVVCKLRIIHCSVWNWDYDKAFTDSRHGMARSKMQGELEYFAKKDTVVSIKVLLQPGMTIGAWTWTLVTTMSLLVVAQTTTRSIGLIEATCTTAAWCEHVQSSISWTVVPWYV